MLRIIKKLNDPSTAPKSYWFILHWFLNNIKIPNIPSIFHNSRVISEFREKARLFNSYFASQCIAASKSSVLRDISSHRNTRINSLTIIEKDIIAIIKSLNLNKSHG